MENKNQKRITILELCSESEYGSWEFWSSGIRKTKFEKDLIFQTIIDLVEQKIIIATEYKYVSEKTYLEVPLNKDRLKKEIGNSLKSRINPETFYWFFATEDGKKEDLRLRGDGGDQD